MPKSVFLSHNRLDKPFVRRLATDLTLAGATVWLDEAEIKLGDSLIRKIEQGIENTDYLAVVLSPNSADSGWVQREVEIALNHEIAGKCVRVLPLLYMDCEIPPFLKGKLYADFRDQANYSKAFQLLVDRLDLDSGEPNPSLPAHLAGTWYGTWAWKGKPREADVLLSSSTHIPSKVVIRYSKLGVQTVVEQELEVNVSGYDIKLTGVGYRFLERGAAVGWHLDTFTLTYDQSTSNLKGTKIDKRGIPVPVLFVRSSVGQSRP